MFRKNFNKIIAIILIFTNIFGYLIQPVTFATDTTGTNNEETEFDGDPKVLVAQEWLNETYTGKYTYKPLTLNGKTGYTTVKALIIALQIELEIGNDSNGTFGEKTTSKCPTISRSNPGNNSNIIKILQHGLFCKGYGTYDLYGTFGKETENAIKELESDAGLDKTGIVTPLIFKTVLNTDPLKKNIRYGDSNIRVIQQALNNKYNKYFGIIPTDGIYERKTNKALIYALQAEEGLSTSVANGHFGTSTKKLCPSLTYGDSRSSFVKLLQYALYCNGYPSNREFDGVYGDEVKSAVTKFQ